jgi:hypothetical protein
VLATYRKRTSLSAIETRYPAAQISAFESVMREHFGERAEGLIAHARDQHAAMMLGLALQQLNQMQRAKAGRTFCALLRHHSSYLWRHARGKVIHRGSIRRLLRIP